MDMVTNYRRYQDVSSAIQASLAGQKPNDFWQYSELWTEIFNHRSAQSNYSDLSISLNDKFSFTQGIAGSLPDSKKVLFSDFYGTFIDKNLVEKYPMSSIGSPSVFDFEGCPASVPYLFNLRLFSEILGLLEKSGGQKPLNILEIGAGFGGLAYFLVRSGIAQSYTVIDLVQNLEISAFHLSQNFPEMTVKVLKAEESVQDISPNTLQFLTPGNIEALHVCKFDLVVNSDSLGEMPAVTAKNYIEWIHGHLSEGGHFFSKNGHRRSRDGVQLPSEFGYQRFEAVGFSPPNSLSSLFDDFSHYVFLRKSSKSSEHIVPGHMNALFSLYALGLQGEMSEISLRLAGNTLSEADKNYLSAIDKFFSEKSLSAKLKILGQVQGDLVGKNTLSYLKGLVLYVDGKYLDAVRELEVYLKSAESYIAESYALMAISKRWPDRLNKPFKFGAKTRFAIDELIGFQKMSPPLRALAYKIRVDILRKKVNYPANYTPGSILKIKNILFNLKEGRGFSAVR